MIVSALIGGLMSLIGVGIQGGMQSAANKRAAKQAEQINDRQVDMMEEQTAFSQESHNKDLRRDKSNFEFQKKMNRGNEAMAFKDLKNAEEDTSKQESLAFKDRLRRGSRLGQAENKELTKRKLERI